MKGFANDIVVACKPTKGCINEMSVDTTNINNLERALEASPTDWKVIAQEYTLMEKVW